MSDMSDSMLRPGPVTSRIQSYPDEDMATSLTSPHVSSKPLSTSPGSSPSSPLQLFVRAKKKINDIYSEVGDYVGSASRFLSTSSSISRDPQRPLLNDEGREKIADFERKATAIQVSNSL